MKKLFFLFFCIAGLVPSVAQDTLQTKQLDEIVVTATRSERTLAELPVPVTIIKAAQIKRMGSLRLSEVLAEQTGLAIVSDHGTGIQMQGFAPEYTLILVDGEPLIGRTAGTLELNRIAVGNIQQIEIVKGPSSSLYGTEALAGVINIITEKPSGVSGSVSSRYGTNNTADIGTTLNYRKNKLGLYAFANRYGTDGYDLDVESKVKTVSPFYNYTLQSKVTYNFSNRTQATFSGRYFNESQTSYAESAEDFSPLNSKSHTTDWNVNPVISHKFSDQFKTTFRFYGSGFRNTTDLTYQNNGTLYDSTFFEQHFYRPEIQAEYFINTKSNVTLGVGRIWEMVEATRYDGRMQYETNYAYLQYEWQPITNLNIIAGSRYDHNAAYTAQFSPKLSGQYNINSWLAVRGSFGVGFRAPDFRQLYLNFTNNTVGYSVFGSQEIATGIQRLVDNGEIINPEENILVDPSSFGTINPETSKAYNIGLNLTPLSKTTISINAFRNDIKDLIDTKAVARKTNGYFVYSYYNLASVFTQGVEVDATYTLSKNAGLSAGYQYLVAKDKEKVKELEAGEVYKRDAETNLTSRVKPEEYGGLFNRSRHMANAKLFYTNMKSGWETSIRAIYRGRYGYADLNNSTVLDDESEYINGYITCNVSLSKTFKETLRLQVGCDNLFDYTDANYIASLPGRLLWTSMSFTLAKKNNKQN